MPFKKMAYALSLLTLLVFSVGMLVYVIFFRMVVAAEVQPQMQLSIQFEKPHRLLIIPRPDRKVRVLVHSW